MDGFLYFSVIGYCDGEVQVFREPRDRARGDRWAADKRPSCSYGV